MYLIVSLDWMSYIRILVWTLIGFSIYFGYGILNSRLNKNMTYGKVLDDEENSNDIVKPNYIPASPHLNGLNNISQ